MVESKGADGDSLIGEIGETAKVRGHFVAVEKRVRRESGILARDLGFTKRADRAREINKQTVEKLRGRKFRSKARGVVAAIRGVVAGSWSVRD